MVVPRQQQFCLARLKPFGARQTLTLRAVPIAAAIIGAAEPPMDGVFDLDTAVLTAPVTGNHIRTVGDAHVLPIGQNRQYPPDISV